MKKRIIVGALLGAFTFGMGAVTAQDTKPAEPKQEEAAPQEQIPMPPDGWWEQLKGGETATYEMTQMGMQMKMTLTVTQVEGAKVTFSTSMEMPGAPQGMPPQTQTIDFADKSQVEEKMSLPKGATIKKAGEETISAGGRDWKCTVYEIEATERGQKMKMKLWHSTELLPVFNNGSVKLEMNMMGPQGQPMSVILTLTSYGTDGDTQGGGGEGGGGGGMGEGGKDKQQ